MTDLLSPNGGANNGANITGTPDFIIVNTLIDHTPGAYSTGLTDTANSFQFLNSVMQFANPKYVNFSSAVVDLSVSGNRTLYGFGTVYNQAATTIYTVKFTIEQTGFVTAANLGTALNGLTVPFTTTAVPTSGGNVSITAYDTTGSGTTNTVIAVTTGTSD